MSQPYLPTTVPSLDALQAELRLQDAQLARLVDLAGRGPERELVLPEPPTFAPPPPAAPSAALRG